MAKNKVEIVKASRVQTPMVVRDDTLFDDDACQQVNRVASIFASSDIVPVHFRNKQANCFIVIHQAKRLDVDPMMMMQHTYVVHGKIGMEAKLVIALMNSRGPFKAPVQWKMEGTGASRQATAWGELRDGGGKCESTVTMAMARAEKWDSDNSSKWRTLPDLMLQYRSATFLARLYCPEVLMGMYSTEELRDIAAATPPAPLTDGKQSFGLGAQKLLDAADVVYPEADTPEIIEAPVAPVAAPVEAPAITPMAQEGFAPSIDSYVSKGPRGAPARVVSLTPKKVIYADGKVKEMANWPDKAQYWIPKPREAVHTDADGRVHPMSFFDSPAPDPAPAPEPDPPADPVESREHDPVPQPELYPAVEPVPEPVEEPASDVGPDDDLGEF